MLMHLTPTSLPRPHSLSELGLAADFDPLIGLSEFTYRRGSEIYGEKEPAEYIYQVKSGTVRSYKLLSDGRRQINAFHVPGDVFGLTYGGNHRFTAEAVADTTLRLIKRESLTAAAENDGTLTRDLLRMTTTNLRHAEDHMLLLGRKTSMERVAAFLIEMDRRLTAAGILALPMPRRDIADYLGLTIETVSRSLSYLRELGVIRFIDNNQRHIVLVDKQQLAVFDRQN
ncbi:helix-turn-helix domain-containing protein [Bradyrhizobium stylosanthis]|uniref:CRP/FNR family nitrogen fixation transcriptional regulator n=1 Tax=Bradyrhizobium stylosanthis TaxID=1803665 RepID=A0A560DMR3_9BRAD|nr:helix-turn-helix domain-containing protein [Bradyrhizobium stylosanthis]TWA98396.1 CRP/FNR family nitrogen fixation transcriptional regulator [Bradyrhizobium stylosanthis]